MIYGATDVFTGKNRLLPFCKIKWNWLIRMEYKKRLADI